MSNTGRVYIRDWIPRCSVDPVMEHYDLKDVLLRVATHPHHLTAQLTPRGWRDTFGSPESNS
jgi:hypothetical protein